MNRTPIGVRARPLKPALAGGATVLAIGMVVVLTVLLFRGSLSRVEYVTVVSERAGLVMNPDAKVVLLGVQVGRVSSIDATADGKAEIRLAIDPVQLRQIPADVTVDIFSPTVFGAKYVHLVPPPDSDGQSLSPGAVIEAGRVTVEFNTIFQQLTRVLGAIDPVKLNQTLGAIAEAFNGRGEQVGSTLQDLEHFLTALQPSLPKLATDLSLLPDVLVSYADSAADLLAAADDTRRIGKTIVDQQQQLDSLLLSVSGIADIATEVVASNRQPAADLLDLLVPTTDLLNRYHPALSCALKGMHSLQGAPPLPFPGVVTLSGVVLGQELYRYPTNLPKVASTGGPHCAEVGLPILPPNYRPPSVVSDDGADPSAYGNQGILLNSDGLKQWLFGPIAGPPRNSAQIGQPG